MGIGFEDGALRRRLAEDDIRARVDLVERSRSAASDAPRGVGCSALPVAMLDHGGGGGAKSPWTLGSSGGSPVWRNAYVLVGSKMLDLDEPAALPGDNYVKVTLGSSPDEDTASVVGSISGDICFFVGKVSDSGRQERGIFSIPIVMVWS